MELKEVYYDFIAFDENPVLSELLEETRVAMDERTNRWHQKEAIF